MASNIIGIGSIDGKAAVVLGVVAVAIVGLAWYILKAVNDEVHAAVDPIARLENNTVNLLSHPIDYLLGSSDPDVGE